ncbi:MULTISPECIES: phytanoyl-CoA dioxygenase family protein [Rhodophyticola]|jgi:hypothetical protein|uniref:phytanoyl-CoA dioxygenase family protein n=1 Tax=Rhodophyticola TaxID=2680018 RepID=UPI0035CF7F7F
MSRPTETNVAEFRDLGYTLIPEFYNVSDDIAPIQEGIRKIVELMLKKYRVSAPCGTHEEAMTLGYPALIRENRAWGGEVYDAIKQIPAFVRLVSTARNDEVFKALRSGSVPGLAAGGYGIRIDNPSEDKFRALWHQEFPAQLRSVDGMVFWSPLLQMTPDMGPVQIAVGSHSGGLVPVYEDDGGIGKSGAYALRLDSEAEHLAQYDIVAPCTNPGDLVLMDFLTLHQSGANVSNRPRWSMQFRYFNFQDPIGIKIGWAGSYAAGQRFEDILPELKAPGA